MQRQKQPLTDGDYWETKILHDNYYRSLGNRYDELVSAVNRKFPNLPATIKNKPLLFSILPIIFAAAGLYTTSSC